MTAVLDAGVERLLTTLLYEGYALYPYTPGATKNATPTPFGIVYPPVYAAGGPHTLDRARMQLVLEPAAPDAPVAGTVAFLEPSGERHQGVERRIELGPAPLDELARTGITIPFAFDAVQGRARLAATPLEGRARARGDVRPQHDAGGRGARPPGGAPLLAAVDPPGRDRARQPLRLAGRAGPGAARAVAACDHVNIFPVLASAADDAVLGAAIVLPDHPKIAPESHGDLFDATEIEEALLLHVLALSDGERAAIAEQDPAVREMLARAEAAGPEEIGAPARAGDDRRPPAPPTGSAPPTSPARGGSWSTASPTGGGPRSGCARGSGGAPQDRRLGRPRRHDRADLPRLRGQRPPGGHGGR